jgi:hypothetical protein
MKKPTKEQLLIDVLSDLTWDQIAMKYGYTDSRFLRKLAVRYQLPQRKVILKPSKEDLESMINQGITPKEIAVKLGYSEGGWSNIYAICREYGIKFDFTINHDLRELDFTPIQKSFVVGTVLGDGYLLHAPDNACLRLTHSIKQLDYLEWKHSLLSNFILSDKPYMRIHNSFNTTTTLCSYSTIVHPFLNELRDIFYPDGVKVISDNVLNLIDEFALAVWYMDDGSINKRYKTIVICTNSFSYEEHLLIQAWFYNRFGIETKIEPRLNHQFCIRINASVSRKFIDIVSPFVPDCMSYKILR